MHIEFSLVLTVIMTRTMQIFQNIRKVNHQLGINWPSISNQQSSPFNWKILFNLLCMIVSFTLQISFLLFKADSALEYATCFFACAIALANILFLLTNLVEMENITKLIENFEKFIDTSKFLLDKNFHFNI